MQNKDYAVMALKEVLIRALMAVAAFNTDGQETVGWDNEFATMPYVEQAEWLIHLFNELVING